MSEPILRLERVNKSFGGIHAVRDCTFDVRPSLITGLIGPNGAGKTTIFNLITGFLRADTGAIRLHNQELRGLAPHQVQAAGVARTFQHLRLWGKMTVLENVLLGCRTPLGESVLTLFLRPKRVRSEEAAARAQAMEVLEFFGLGTRAFELAEDLAYPEQKLLSMARIFATDAQVLLLDEPTSGLDTDSLAKIVPMVRKLVERGKTVLLIEHNMELIAQLSDEVVFLHEGRVLARGKADQITRDPALTEIYFGV
jgi:branched-chain amino acid transport system ATP-binding protein/branched-chain amino acid transport system permease protein